MLMIFDFSITPLFHFIMKTGNKKDWWVQYTNCFFVDIKIKKSHDSEFDSININVCFAPEFLSGINFDGLKWWCISSPS